MSYTRLFSDEKRKIAYRPALARRLGNIVSAIFLQQVVYWWDGRGEKEFYKFISPCDHKAYKKGDSWREELMFTRREIELALETVATRLSKDKLVDGKVVKGISKTAALRGSDLKNLVIYRSDSNRVTWWTLNDRLLNEFLADIYGEDHPPPENTGGEEFNGDRGDEPDPNFFLNKKPARKLITKRTASKADPRIRSMPIAVYKEIMEVYPNKQDYDEIIAAVGIDEVTWRSALTKLCAEYRAAHESGRDFYPFSKAVALRKLAGVKLAGTARADAVQSMGDYLEKAKAQEAKDRALEEKYSKPGGI